MKALPEMDELYSVAEIAIAIAGFAAIVASFKRRADGSWDGVAGNYFNGMLIHSTTAVLFCVLPALLGAFLSSPQTVWAIASSMLGIQILVHATIIVRLPASGLGTRLLMMIGALVAALQAYNALVRAEFEPYLVGILWHVMHAGGLFVSLVWVPAEEIDSTGDSSP